MALPLHYLYVSQVAPDSIRRVQYAVNSLVATFIVGARLQPHGIEVSGITTAFLTFRRHQRFRQQNVFNKRVELVLLVSRSKQLAECEMNQWH